RPTPAKGCAVAGLDLDDRRAQVGEQPASHLAGERLRKLEDDDALEGAAAVGAREIRRHASPNTRAAFPKSHLSFTLSFSGRFRYSSIKVSYVWPTSPAERPTSTLSWMSVLPNCISISQPEPGWPRYFARCAEVSMCRFGCRRTIATISLTHGQPPSP